MYSFAVYLIFIRGNKFKIVNKIESVPTDSVVFLLALVFSGALTMLEW